MFFWNLRLNSKKHRVFWCFWIKFQKKHWVFLEFYEIPKTSSFPKFQNFQNYAYLWKYFLEFWKTRCFVAIFHVDGWLYIWLKTFWKPFAVMGFYNAACRRNSNGWRTDASKRCHSGFAGGGPIFCCLPSVVGTTELEMTTSTTHPARSQSFVSPQRGLGCIPMNSGKPNCHRIDSNEWRSLNGCFCLLVVRYLRLPPHSESRRTHEPFHRNAFQFPAGCKMSEIEWMAVGHWCRNSPIKPAHSSGHMAFGGMELLCHLS